MYSPERAAEYLSLRELGVRNPVKGIRYLVKKGKLRAIKILGRLAFLEDDLNTFLMRLQQESKKKEKR